MIMESDSLILSEMLHTGGDDSIQAHRFAHKAMATIFEIVCIYEDRSYAAQAAQAAFDLIDRLETALTRHRASSEISQISRGKPGEVMPVSPWTLECLLLAQHFYSETGGAFDVSLGSGLDAVEINPSESSVTVHTQMLRLDLGGIGKGYAIDRAGELLQEWEIDRAVIHGGFSSVLVLEPPPDREGWPLTISMPGGGPTLERFVVQRQSWSASGIRKRDHILDTRTGLPVHNRLAAWVSGSLEALQAAGCMHKPAGSMGIFETGDSPSAVAEALSTAFMIMPLEEIARYCLRYPGIEARLLIPDRSGSNVSPLRIHFVR
jgi:thiamine biosynthesis lipoprotein